MRTDFYEYQDIYSNKPQKAAKPKQKAKSKKRRSGSVGIFFLTLVITLGIGGGTLFALRDSLTGFAFTQPKLYVYQGLKDNDQETVLKVTSRAPDSYLSEFVFIGDSRTNGLKMTGTLGNDQIFAEDGLCHSNALDTLIDLNGRSLTIPEAVEEASPSIALINFGINGIAWLGEEEFIEDYEILLNELVSRSPETTIIIESILPVSRSKELSEPRMSNEKIDRYNELLKDLAEEKGFYYLDSASALKNDDNRLSSDYDSGDGLHFNTAGSVTILEQVLTHALNLNQN